ncbi:MAG: SDR family oxidoreductase [Flavobacteriaceae bacterium]|nr:SDR family oxidoreductase [Flavobacteriaceae bacterium]
MKILLTGATGYIGKRLLPLFLEAGHHVVCAVRDAKRFHPPVYRQSLLEVVEMDLLDLDSLTKIPKNIDLAFYLVHSMSSASDYTKLEQQSAKNFRMAVATTNVQQVIYLSGIVNESELSDHLRSRMGVEQELQKGPYHLTTFRAGIIIGSGSASFEIMRDLVEKLPVMVTPKWLHTRCQPIGISDVLLILTRSMLCAETYDQNFDIGCPDVLSYKEMLMELAAVRGLGRRIFILPVMTPRLSSYWLYFVTSTSYKLACSLVDSMKVEVVCRDLRILDILNVCPISYREALEKAFFKIENKEIPSSWKDAYSSSGMEQISTQMAQLPQFGCFADRRELMYINREKTLERIWSIGGETGWYYGNFLWRIRGYLDKLVGGVGLRRGRTNISHIAAGDALDFWRVLYADKEEGRLLLYAEMKLPGEAWLEFRIQDNKLLQTAIFRPLGLAGRFYWYAVLPFHGFIFKGMIAKLCAS